MRYDAFLSYSHAADDALAPALQSGLHRLARPWNRMRALRIFRDKTSLSASPELWPAIVSALGDAKYFLLLASPAAAASRWVQKEVEWWLAHRSPQTLLILVTDGQLTWDEAAADFDWAHTDAIAPILRGRFPSEPLWVDLRWARSGETLSLRHVQFRQAVLDVAAPLHGRSKDELDGEDVRQFARTRRLARAAIAGLIVLTVSATAAAWFAVRQRDEARRQGTIAQAGRLAAQADLRRERGGPVDASTMLAAEAVRLLDTIGERSLESDLALRRALALQARRLGEFEAFSDDDIAVASDGRHIAVRPIGRDWSVHDTSGQALGGCSFERIRERLAAKGRPQFAIVQALTATGSHCAVLAIGSPKVHELGVWSASPLEELAVVRHPGGTSLRVALSEDAEYLAVTDLAEGGGGRPGAFRIWSRSRKADVVTQAGAEFVDFSPDRTTFAASDGLWRLPAPGQSTATRVVTWPRQPWQVVFSADGRVAATRHETTLAVWDVATARLVRETPHDSGTLLAVHGHGRLLLLTVPRAGALVWDQEAEQVVATTPVQPKVAFFDLDGLIVVTSPAAALRTITYAISAHRLAGGAVARSALGAGETVRWLGIDGTTVTTVIEADRSLRLDAWMPLASGRVPRMAIDGTGLQPMAISGDARHVALGGATGVRIGALAGGGETREVALPGRPVELALDAHGGILAAAVDGRLELRNLRDGAAWHTALPDGVESIGLSSDGRWAAVVRKVVRPFARAGDAFELVAWRTFAAAPAVSIDLERHLSAPRLDCQAGVSGAALRVDGLIVDLATSKIAKAPDGATGGPCNAIASATLRAVIAGQQVTVSDRHDVPLARLDHPVTVQRAAVADDGRHAVTLDELGVLRMWALGSRDLVAQACAERPTPLDAAGWAALPPAIAVDACGRARPAADAAPP